jgi:hypothetical protein
MMEMVLDWDDLPNISEFLPKNYYERISDDAGVPQRVRQNYSLFLECGNV